MNKISSQPNAHLLHHLKQSHIIIGLSSYSVQVQLFSSFDTIIVAKTVGVQLNFEVEEKTATANTFGQCM